MKRMSVIQAMLLSISFLILIFYGCRKVNNTLLGYELSVDAITPNSGKVNTLVTIKGKGFSLILREDTIKFNGQPAEIKKATDTSLEVYAPQGGSTGPVTVSVGGQTAKGPVFTFTATANPLITKAEHGWYDGSGYAINVQNVSGNNADIKVYVNNVNIAFDDIVRVGHPQYDPAKGEQILIKNDTTVTANVPLNFADFRITSRDNASNTYQLQVIPQARTLTSKYGETILTAGDTITIAGNFFGDRSLPSSIKINYRDTEITPAILSWTNTQVKFILPIKNNIQLHDPANVNIAVQTNTLTSRYLSCIYEGIVTARVTLIAGSEQGYQDGNNVTAKFNNPYGIAADADGNIYISEEGNHRIRVISPQGVVSTYVGSSQGFADGGAGEARFNRPQGLASRYAHGLVVADAGNNRIRVIDGERLVFTYAGSGSQSILWEPNSVAIDATNNTLIYTSEKYSHRISKITDFQTINTLAGSTEGFADGVGTAVRFKQPQGIAFYQASPATSYLYVADAGNNRIRRISMDGTTTTVAGNGTAGNIDGAVASAQFNNPTCVAIDINGNMYISSAANGHIRKISKDGLASTLSAVFSDGKLVHFIAPAGLLSDKQGNIYVVDYGGHKIYRMSF